MSSSQNIKLILLMSVIIFNLTCYIFFTTSLPTLIISSTYSIQDKSKQFDIIKACFITKKENKECIDYECFFEYTLSFFYQEKNQTTKSTSTENLKVGDVTVCTVIDKKIENTIIGYPRDYSSLIIISAISTGITLYGILTNIFLVFCLLSSIIVTKIQEKEIKKEYGEV